MILKHSAKGSEWEEHKYIKKINGEYYYPDNYEGGRHLNENNKDGRIEEGSEIDDELVEKMARDVVKGLFGNGQIRKDLLGKNYQQIQDRVNELMKGKAGNIKSSKELANTEAVKESKDIVKKVVSKNNSMDLDKVYSVYKNRGK